MLRVCSETLITLKSHNRVVTSTLKPIILRERISHCWYQLWHIFCRKRNFVHVDLWLYSYQIPLWFQQELYCQNFPIWSCDRQANHTLADILNCSARLTLILISAANLLQKKLSTLRQMKLIVQSNPIDYTTTLLPNHLNCPQTQASEK